jgi:hypothetical protein
MRMKRDIACLQISRRLSFGEALGLSLMTPSGKSQLGWLIPPHPSGNRLRIPSHWLWLPASFYSETTALFLIVCKMI